MFHLIIQTILPAWMTTPSRAVLQQSEEGLERLMSIAVRCLLIFEAGGLGRWPIGREVAVALRHRWPWPPSSETCTAEL